MRLLLNNRIKQLICQPVKIAGAANIVLAASRTHYNPIAFRIANGNISGSAKKQPSVPLILLFFQYFSLFFTNTHFIRQSPQLVLLTTGISASYCCEEWLGYTENHRIASITCFLAVLAYMITYRKTQRRQKSELRFI